MQQTGPPLPPDQVRVPISERAHHLQRVLVGSTVPLLVFMITLLGLRIFQKSRKGSIFGYDDAFIIAGVMCAIASWGLIMAMVFYQVGFETPTATLATIMFVMKITVPSIVLWGWAIAFIKISVAFMLLRFENKKSWRTFLWIMVFVQVLFGLYNMLFILLRCRPLHKQWDFISPGDCVSNQGIRISSIVLSVVNVMTDLLFSFTPLNFILTLNRSKSEKTLLFILMATGLVASSASIIKSNILGLWATPTSAQTDDTFAPSIVVVIWTSIEMFLAAMAACAPYLKAPLQYTLSLLGFDFTLTINLPTRERPEHSEETTTSGGKTSDGSSGWTSQVKSEPGTDTT